VNKYEKRFFTLLEKTTRTTTRGGKGTLKAKATKKFGKGKMTCSKARKLKTKKATAHTKAQSNWFLNFHCKK
jgi:hypothetical protein